MSARCCRVCKNVQESSHCDSKLAVVHELAALVLNLRSEIAWCFDEAQRSVRRHFQVTPEEGDKRSAFLESRNILKR